MGVRKVGVEEELLLVDPKTRMLRHVSKQVVHPDGDPAEPTLQQELFRSQVETATSPTASLDDIDTDLRRCRQVAAKAAAAANASIVAVASPVLAEATIRATAEPRYERIVDDFGETVRQTVAMGMHVHVDVASDDEAVAVLDGIRPWLPVLLALSVNSPLAFGMDTAYASWRSQMWGRWPTAGPTEPFGDAATYHRSCEALVSSGAAVDRGMLYFDARLAELYPTVEIRVADVCTEVDDAVLVTALARAVTETAAREWAAGETAPAWRTEMVRAASWRAARFGLSGTLMHPLLQSLVPAREAVEMLIGRSADVLDEAGDLDRVRTLFEQLVRRGSGAARQRAVAEATGSLEAVVDDLCERTERSFADV